MPATIRLLFTLILLGGIGYGGMYALGTFFEPGKSEIVKPIPRSRFVR